MKVKQLYDEIANTFRESSGIKKGMEETELVVRLVEGPDAGAMKEVTHILIEERDGQQRCVLVVHG